MSRRSTRNALLFIAAALALLPCVLFLLALAVPTPETP